MGHFFRDYVHKDCMRFKIKSSCAEFGEEIRRAARDRADVSRYARGDIIKCFELNAILIN